jgi:hypothetical protein
LTAAAAPGAAGAARQRAQLLSGRRPRTVQAVAERLLAIQAQDARGARLAVRARSTGLTAAAVDHALTEERSVVVSWLNRGTLHLVPAEDWWWLHPLTTPQLRTGNQRRLREEGVSPAQAATGVDVVTAAVAEHGPQTRAELRDRLQRADVPTAGQALVHVLFAATLEGHIVRGPVVGDDQAFVAVEDWLGPAPAPLDRDEALARLARRYLAGHGPAAPPDLARWAGIPLGEARRGFAAIAAETTDWGDGSRVLGAIGRSARHLAPAGPRLLGPFDPLLLGWASRAALVGNHAGIVTVNGIFRPVVLVDGKVVARWGLAKGVLTVTPLDPVPPAALPALRREAADISRFLGVRADFVVADGPA